MKQLEPRRLILRDILAEDLPILHIWRNEERFIRLCCSYERGRIGYEEFVEGMKRNLGKTRHMQLIIALKESKKLIGTIFAYGLNRVDGYVFVTTYLVREQERKGYGPEAVLLFSEYLFFTLSIHKVYLEAFGYNDHSLSVLRKSGISEEGCFKEHRFFGGVRYDVYRFALYRDFRRGKLGRILEKIKRKNAANEIR